MRKKPIIDGKIDLHGMTQDQAYDALQRFFQAAIANKKRTILIITGKGALNNPCILKVSVPRWLQYTELKRYILSYSTAPAALGGEGAILAHIVKIY